MEGKEVEIVIMDLFKEFCFEESSKIGVNIDGNIDGGGGVCCDGRCFSMFVCLWEWCSRE